MNCRDCKGRAEIIVRTESALMTKACFFVTFPIGNSSHSFEHPQIDRHRGGILVPLPTGFREAVEVFGLYEVIFLLGYNSLLCLLALRCSQETDWSHYGGSDPAFFGYDFKTRQVFDVLRLRANKRYRTGSRTIVDVAAHEVRRLGKIKFASFQRFEFEWREFGGVAGLAGGGDVIVVDQSVSDDLELLFARDARCTPDVGALKPELQMEWELLRNEMPGLQTVVRTGSLWLLKFGREVIMKNKSLVEEIGVLQNTVADEQAAQKISKEDFGDLKGVIPASGELAANLAESEK